MVSANALRNASTTRGSTPGGATTGRPMDWREKIISSTWRSSGFFTKSVTSGTSGNSLCLASAS